ncbi:cucumber peeling cupredoxin-like [Diospyros lotus]|uniref:cucumber peeling cupredoxin-like n=1 Tax=Diospyros lotus TaxID=55363 RepID=UPI00225398BC|nr:cucumber peeling cupredoxin-like [Diospyros lotus]
MARLAFLAIAVVAALVEGSTAASYTVGDDSGWRIPSSGASFYSDWAAKHTFAVGDSLVFDFATGQHDVATVSESQFSSCTAGNQIVTTGPATIKLDSASMNYYICTIGSHCSSGQKLSINVTSAATPSGSPPPPASPGSSPPPPAATAPPPPNSAPPAAVGASSFIIMTIAMAFL